MSLKMMRWNLCRKMQQPLWRANVVGLQTLKLHVHLKDQIPNSQCCSYSTHYVKSPFKSIDFPDIMIPELVWNMVDRFPESNALKCGLTGRVYKYAEVKKLSQRFMNSLIMAGFSQGDVLALVSQNCPEFALVTLGALEADMTVSFVNHVYTADEICHQLKDSGSVCVVTGVSQLATVQAAIAKLEETTQSKSIRRIIVVDIPSPPSLPTGVSRLSEMIADNIDHSKYNSYKNKPNDPAFLPYSSGTTGLSKGVCLSHRNIVCNVLQVTATEVNIFSPEKGQDLVLGVLPLYHIYGLVITLLNTLANGGQLITLPKFKPEWFVYTLDNEKITVLFLVPPLMIFLGTQPKITTEHLAHVRYIFSGAAPLRSSDVVGAIKKVPPNCVISQGFGMTELSPTALIPVFPVKDFATVGAPLSNTLAKVVDPDSNKILGPNETGELYIKGPQVMLGYHNNPKATADMIDSEGWLKTGDIGYYDEDSHFYINDRLKELIKVKGFQVPPAELEALLRTHPLVSDVGVIGVPDPRAGELPVAYIVPHKDMKVTEEQIKDFLSDKVAKHKQVSQVIFIDSIPKSAAGKILRKELRQLYKASQK